MLGQSDAIPRMVRTARTVPALSSAGLSSPLASSGGTISGFFGGLSGNQGALRSAFLLKAGLSKKAFVATGVVSAVIFDAVRLMVYGTTMLAGQFS